MPFLYLINRPMKRGDVWDFPMGGAECCIFPEQQAALAGNKLAGAENNKIEYLLLGYYSLGINLHMERNKIFI